MLKRLFVCHVLLLSLNAIAGDDPWLLLQKTALAARELNYQGVFAYQNAQQLRYVQITHMNNAGKELTRNVVLDGQQREVFSEGQDIIIFNAKNDKVVIEKRYGQNLFPAMLPTSLDGLKTTYVAKFGGVDRVAGREAQIIELIPHDGYRYTYKVWTDMEYGLLLKMALLDNVKVLEQIGFTQLSMLNTKNLDWFQPKIDLTKRYVMEDTTEVNHVTEDWIVANLPAGYKKVDHIQRVIPGKNATVNQMIYSDGIASVSVFIEPVLKGVRPKLGHKISGPTNMCANVVDGYQVVVVGEVPAQTVQHISRAISFKKRTVVDK